MVLFLLISILFFVLIINSYLSKGKLQHLLSYPCRVLKYIHLIISQCENQYLTSKPWTCRCGDDWNKLPVAANSEQKI